MQLEEIKKRSINFIKLRPNMVFPKFTFLGLLHVGRAEMLAILIS